MALKDLISAGFSARQARRLLLEFAGGGGGGGSAFGGVTQVTTNSGTTTNSGGGQYRAFNGWVATAYATGKSSPAVTIDNPNFNWTPTLAGWYSIAWILDLEFSSNAPASVRFENINYYDNFGTILDLATYGADAAPLNGRQNPGVQAIFNTGVFYTEAAATVGGSGVKPFVAWAGTTAVISRARLTGLLAQHG